MSAVAASVPPGAAEPSEQERVYDWFRRQHWTPDAYLALAANSNHLIELSDGKLLILPMPTLSHQRAVRKFVARVAQWTEQDARGEVLFAPHPVRLWPGKYREPDAMVYLSAHLDRLAERESGPPDLVLEVQSPGTTRLDLIEKFEEYALAGIPEYWMVDVQAQRVSVFILTDQAYRLLAHHSAGELARSQILPGFQVAVDELLPG